MEPFMAPELGSAQKLELIGMISHQGTEKHGHYVAVTKKGEDWTLHNDASTTQITPAHSHQSQAYILLYRKTKPSTETETQIPTTGTSQLLTEKLKPTYQRHNSPKRFPPQPYIPKKPHMEHLPHQERSGTGVHLIPTPTEGPTIENSTTPEILHNTHYAPQTPESRGTTVTGGTIEPEETDTPLTEQADRTEDPPQEEKGTGQPENELNNLPQSISTFLHLSRGRIEELTSLLSELSGTPLTTKITTNWLSLEPQDTENSHDSLTKKLLEGLSEDPEDHPAEYIPIIERHSARLKKAHLLLGATQDIIQRGWEEGTTLEDIGKFLQSWAPEPYRNKPMPKGMLQALLNITPNSRTWAPIDLSNCIFRMPKPQTPSQIW